MPHSTCREKQGDRVSAGGLVGLELYPAELELLEAQQAERA